MTNKSVNQGDEEIFQSVFYVIFSYVPLGIIASGLIGNSLCFILFRFHKHFKRMTPMVYLSFVAITDTLALFEWNLDHYLILNTGFSIGGLSEFTCHVYTFVQYSSLQASALLLSMLSVDRYFTVVSTPGSFFSKLPFRTKKSAFAWSFMIVSVIILINSHLLIASRHVSSTFKMFNLNNQSFNLTLTPFECYEYANGFLVNPIWDNVHLVIFDLVPFFLMLLFNGLLIRNLFQIQLMTRHKASSKRDARNARLTISLIFVTFMFLVMTLPSSVLFGFYVKQINIHILNWSDNISFLNNSSLFAFSLITIPKFRKILFRNEKVAGFFNFLFKKQSLNYLMSPAVSGQSHNVIATNV
jgi:hypothetical protein